jgi:hypothetical protein
MRKKKIYCVMDNLGWVQHRRYRLLREKIKDYDLADASRFTGLRALLPEKFLLPAYFFSWRIVRSNSFFLRLPLERCMCSVTSHYNIGGGLNEQATATGGCKEPIKQAVNILKKFKVVTVNSKLLLDMLSFYIEDIVIKGRKTYKQAHDEIHEILYRQKVKNKFETWLEALKKRAAIKIML